LSNCAIIFIGPPGSGKGTLSSLCVSMLGWEQLSTGNLCRKHISEGTSIGQQIDFAIKSGKLISDRLMTDMVDEWLATETLLNKTLILDGYPRTIPQATALDELLKTKYTSLKLHIFRFVVPDECVISRLGTRYICQNNKCQAVYSLAEGSSLAPKRDMICDQCKSPLGQRKDDTREAVHDRMIVYHLHEKELISFYRNAGYEVVEVDANRPHEEVFESFKKIITPICQISKQ